MSLDGKDIRHLRRTCATIAAPDLDPQATAKGLVTNCPTCGARVATVFDHVDGCPPVVKRNCGTCAKLCTAPDERLRRIANTEEGGRLRAKRFKAGVCTANGLWCGLSSLRCGGDDYQAKN